MFEQDGQPHGVVTDMSLRSQHVEMHVEHRDGPPIAENSHFQKTRIRDEYRHFGQAVGLDTGSIQPLARYPHVVYHIEYHGTREAGLPSVIACGGRLATRADLLH
jgi:hypothetical protein